MGTFFGDDMLVAFRKTNNPLLGVVKRLSPSAKQAFLAAAKQGRLARGTWNGCAFNAAGKLQQENVSTVTKAAEVFDMKAGDVSRFIRVWDNLYCRSDWWATRLLKEAIESIGLFTPAGTMRFRAFTSEDTVIREAFDLMVKNDSVEFTSDAVELLLNA